MAILTAPLFWLYLSFLFFIFIFLTNRIGFHPPCGADEFKWTASWCSVFLGGMAGSTFLFLRHWDFSWDGFLGLPWPSQGFLLFVALWIFWMALDHLAWKLLVLKPVAFEEMKQDRIPVSDRFVAPFGFLKHFGVANQIYHPQVTGYELKLENWPKEFSGLTIVHISDLHYGQFFSREYLATILKKAKSLKPDLYALTGDFINWKKDVPAMKGLLKGFKARYGVYAVLGNHDMGADPVGLTQSLKKDGIRVMENEVVTFRKKGKTLALMGAAELWFGSKNDTAIRECQADAKILLAHHPDHFFLAKETNAHLQLSGHTHGGQICFPILGPLIVPSNEGRKYAGGFYKEKNSVLFVTDGIGCYPPLRTLCPPEIVKLTILSA